MMLKKKMLSCTHAGVSNQPFQRRPHTRIWGILMRYLTRRLAIIDYKKSWLESADKFLWERMLILNAWSVIELDISRWVFEPQGCSKYVWLMSPLGFACFMHIPAEIRKIAMGFLRRQSFQRTLQIQVPAWLTRKVQKEKVICHGQSHT